MATAVEVRQGHWEQVDNEFFEQLVAEACAADDDPTEATLHLEAALNDNTGLRRRISRPVFLLGLRATVNAFQGRHRASAVHPPAECGRSAEAELDALAGVTAQIMEAVYEGKPIGDYTKDELVERARAYRGRARGFETTALWMELVAERCKGGRPVRKCLKPAELRALRMTAEKETR